MLISGEKQNLIIFPDSTQRKPTWNKGPLCHLDAQQLRTPLQLQQQHLLEEGHQGSGNGRPTYIQRRR